MPTDTWARLRVTPSWWFESVLWDISSQFPLISHFDLPDSECIWCISGSSHVHVGISQPRWILVKRPTGS